MENKKGPNDLEQRIEDLEKQKEYLQGQCRKASEERDNFVTMLGDGKK